MIKLKSFTETFNRYAILKNDNSVELIQSSMKIEDIVKMDGVFHILNNKILAEYSFEKINYYFYDGVIYRMSDQYSLKYKRVNEDNCLLIIMDESLNSLEIQYQQKDYSNIDRIGFTESEEDYNFGLWLFNKFNRDQRENS